MNPFEFVIAIIFLAFLTKAVCSYFESKRDAGRTRQQEKSELDTALARMVQLEERIKVLERIVTDEQFDVRQRFRNL